MKRNNTYNQRKKKDGLLITFFLIFLIGICISTFFMVTLILKNSNQKKYNFTVLDLNDSNFAEDCDGSDLFNFSYCMHSYVSEIFKYNISNIDKKLDFNQLVKEGGVCSHYTGLYIDNAKKNNFTANDVIINPRKGDIGHEFAVISNSQGYCLLDQDIEPFCVELG